MFHLIVIPRLNVFVDSHDIQSDDVKSLPRNAERKHCLTWNYALLWK